MLALLPASMILALAQPVAQPVAPPTSAAGAPVTTQLPTNARPLHYDISLFPDANQLRFRGHTGIDVEVLVPSSALTFNARDLAFTGARLTGRDVDEKSRISVDAASQTATVLMPKAVAPGVYRLELDYTGTIGTVADGLFALNYDADGASRRALYTQFENSSARGMFPSWDEPAYKATFTLDVTAPASMMAVSNMPVAKRTVSGDTMHVLFASTPKMSTYLVFFFAWGFRACHDESWCNGDWRRYPSRESGPGILRARIVSRCHRALQPVFWNPVSAPQARQRCCTRAKPVFRCHGELGRHFLV
jgi:aminopeptidase N